MRNKMLTMLLALTFLFAGNAFATVKVFDGTTDHGHFDEINLGTTLEGSRTSGQMLIQDSGVVLTEDVTATNTIAASECGTTFFLNSATEFESTLPAMSAVSAGCHFTFIVKAAPSGASYTVVTDSSANILIGGINELEVDTGDDGPYDGDGDTITFVNSVSVVGDYVYLIADGTSWNLRGQANADGGITVTKAS